MYQLPLTVSGGRITQLQELVPKVSRSTVLRGPLSKKQHDLCNSSDKFLTSATRTEPRRSSRVVPNSSSKLPFNKESVKQLLPNLCLDRLDFSKFVKRRDSWVIPKESHGTRSSFVSRRKSEESDESTSTDSGYDATSDDCDDFNRQGGRTGSCPELEKGNARGEASKTKEGFLAGLGLVSISSPCVGNQQHELLPDFPLLDEPVLRNGRKNVKGFKPRRSNRLLFNFVKAHPLSLASGLGRRLVLQHAHLDITAREKSIAKYEKWCKSKQVTAVVKAATSRKQVRDNTAEGHKYTFSKKERRDRDVEITVGLNKKSFAAFNKCRKLSVCLDRLKEEDILRVTSWQQRKEKSLSFLQNPHLYLPFVVLEDCQSLLSTSSSRNFARSR